MRGLVGKLSWTLDSIDNLQLTIVNYLTHTDVIIIARNAIHHLEGIAHTYLIYITHAREETVIVTFSPSKSIAFAIESHTGNNGKGDSIHILERLPARLHDAVSPNSEAVFTAISMDCHLRIADNLREKHRLSLGMESLHDR